MQAQQGSQPTDSTRRDDDSPCPAQAQPTEEHPLHRILVVDDDRAIREMFMRVLSYRLPYCQVDVALSGEEAISGFRSAYYDVILMDMRMPEMNGDVAYREIEEICRCNDREPPAVIFITGFEPSASLKEVVQQDDRHCLLRKPFKRDELMNAIKSRLEFLDR